MDKFVFKNQPSGRCYECIWNKSANQFLDCNCPQTHLTNAICLQKRISVNLSNIYYGISDGEDWKNE